MADRYAWKQSLAARSSAGVVGFGSPDKGSGTVGWIPAPAIVEAVRRSDSGSMILFRRPDTGGTIWLREATAMDCYGFPDETLQEPPVA
jgi:hypothetical protein